MWSKVWIVVFCMYIAKGTQNLIKFDEEILKKLEIISRIDSYDQFELFNKYQCAIECLKDKNNCAGYSFDQTNNTCSLFEDSNKIIDKEALEWVNSFFRRFAFEKSLSSERNFHQIIVRKSNVNPMRCVLMKMNHDVFV